MRGFTVFSAVIMLGSSANADTPVYSYKVKHAYPHDPSAFTQGLVYADGILYEGTGLRGRSSVRLVELETGNVLKQTSLLPMFFGEGIAVYGDKIYQLTWTSRVGFVYDKSTLKLLRQFNYGTEGWGMTHDGERLIVSDGSAVLYFWDPETLRETGRVTVTEGGRPVSSLNELEYIEGEIWANVWQYDRLVRIVPETGKVVGWVDLQGLLPPSERRGTEDVLNGIAYDREARRLFVTGKNWPKLYEIEIVPPEP